MTQIAHVLQIGDIFRADFRTSVLADSENTRIQKACGFQFRYQPARLAIAVSLSDRSTPEPSDSGGKPIKGDTLFGQDEADLTSWIALIVQHRLQETSRRDFQDYVSAHWARGIARIGSMVDTESVNIETLVERLVYQAK